MTASELMLEAIRNGLEDDRTTSAALDAIREDSGCSLLAAVLEVARVHKATRDARDITEATSYLDESSAIHRDLKQSIHDECLNIPDGALVTITVQAGDLYPLATDNSEDNGAYEITLASIAVGALWVKREASRLLLEREREARRPRRRRSL